MYRVVIFAAIGVLFVFPPAAELAGVELSTWGPIEMAMVTAVVLGIDAFWWWVLFIRDEPRSVASGSTATDRSGRRALAEFKFWQTCIVLAVIGGFWLFTGGDLEHGVGRDEIVIWVAMVLLPTLILVVRLSTGLGGARAS